jgi:hypothetical protein
MRGCSKMLQVLNEAADSWRNHWAGLKVWVEGEGARIDVQSYHHGRNW